MVRTVQREIQGNITIERHFKNGALIKEVTYKEQVDSTGKLETLEKITVYGVRGIKKVVKLGGKVICISAPKVWDGVKWTAPKIWYVLKKTPDACKWVVKTAPKVKDSIKDGCKWMSEKGKNGCKWMSEKGTSVKNGVRWLSEKGSSMKNGLMGWFSSKKEKTEPMEVELKDAKDVQ